VSIVASAAPSTGLGPEPSDSLPVTAATRMDVLDVLRGIAIFGILIFNIGALSGYELLPAPERRGVPGAGADDTVAFLLEFLVQGKFYCLFSLLFGVGFAVFIDRASARGADGVRLFKRRLTGLILIALVHTLLIWFGDILLVYAVLGFGLIPFARRDDRTVLRWAAGMLAAPVALYAVLLAIAAAGPAPAPASAGDAGLPPIMAGAVEGMHHGSYPDVVKGNAIFTAANVVRRLVLMFYPRVFGMFLLGLYAQRRRIFSDLAGHRVLLLKICSLGLLVGLPLAAAGAFMGDSGSPRTPTIGGLVEVMIESIGTPALSLGYAAAICLMFQSARAKRVLLWIAPTGRMALSNYLLHSIASVIAFYGIGFGLYGRFSLATLVALCAGFFAAQTLASALWLRTAWFGPAEWLWRQFTYRRRFALFRVGRGLGPRHPGGV
jgi:uncharacterized protein